MALLEVEKLRKDYPEGPALRGVSMGLEKGRVLCLLGPSGCGKTTLLRLIAGLEEPDSGRVIFDGKDFTSVPPHLRRFGMMFQEFALFPHKNIYENVAFGLRMQRRPEKEIVTRVDRALSMVGLSGFGPRNVSDLSGGERQRVALARCLCPRPELLLLDEPMGALDRLLRDRLVRDLRRILKDLGQTAVFVTHDQGEALAVADVIAVLNKGRVVQVDEPRALYKRPANAFVARFLGLGNLLSGVFTKDGIKTEQGFFPIDHAFPNGSPGLAVLPPDALRILEERDSIEAHEAEISGVVADAVFQGRGFRVGLSLPNGEELAFDLLPDISTPQPGRSVRLAINNSGILAVPAENN